MSAESDEVGHRFPRARAYHPDWLRGGVSGGANPLWLTEWLVGAMELRPGMGVPDLGCGRGLSSVFLAREFGVQVWAVDLWFDLTERWSRIRDAGVADREFPIHADARALPFPAEFFDAIVSIDSYVYCGTDDLYLGYLAGFVRVGGEIGWPARAWSRSSQQRRPNTCGPGGSPPSLACTGRPGGADIGSVAGRSR